MGGKFSEKSELQISHKASGTPIPLTAQRRSQRRKSAACAFGSRPHKLEAGTQTPATVRITPSHIILEFTILLK
jgi:hypothetical protein